MQTTTGTDKQQYRQFYQENLRLIYRYVYSYVRSHQEAEDLTAHIFLKAAHSLHALKDEYNSQAWLLQAARTAITDYQRSQDRIAANSSEQVVDTNREEAATGETAFPTNEAIQRVQQILQIVPTRDREVLTYRFLLNLTAREIALLMDVTEPTIIVLQWHALQRAADSDDITT